MSGLWGVGDDRPADRGIGAGLLRRPGRRGARQGDVPPDDLALSKFRRQALGWLKAELAAWSRIVELGTPQDRAKVATISRHWRKDADLPAVRDTDALATLPEADRNDWQAYWVEYETLMGKGEEVQPR